MKVYVYVSGFGSRGQKWESKHTWDHVDDEKLERIEAWAITESGRCPGAFVELYVDGECEGIYHTKEDDLDIPDDDFDEFDEL